MWPHPVASPQGANQLVAHRSDAEIRANEKAYHDLLRELVASLKGVNSVWVFGEDGVPVVTSVFYPAPRFTFL